MRLLALENPKKSRRTSEPHITRQQDQSLIIPNPRSDACLACSRHVRATLAGPVARKHFQALSIARWGEGCRCHYTVAKATETSTQEDDGGVVGDDGNTDVRSTGAMEKSVEKVVGGDNTSTSAESCTKEEGPDWLAFYLRRVGHRAVRPSPLDLLQVRA